MTARCDFFPYRMADVSYAPSYDAERPALPPLFRVETIFDAFIESALAYPADRESFRDQDGKALTARALLGRSLALARLFQRETEASDSGIALMLPNALGTVIALMASQALSRTTIMLNFNAGAAALIGSCETAQVTTIFTSRRFIEAAELSLLIETLEAKGLRVVYLEDLRQKATLRDKLTALAVTRFPRLAKRLRVQGHADDPALILFTSGSEGQPKGVALSHRNVLSNVAQFTARVELTEDDVMFACLPLFHSFGLTVGLLLPLATGMNIVFYPSPLHYHQVPEKIRETKATLLLSTDTFLCGYARCGKAEDFASLRIIVGGAEKVKEGTHKLWRERFGKNIMEGYGATETAPVLAVNAPNLTKPGTVGLLLPDIEASLQPVPGLKNGGSLCVKGPNIMLGHILHEAPGIIQPPANGWYNTGDIAEIDAEGYLSIHGRLKRFAKIAGEMVSLSAIEQAASRTWPESVHAVLNVPHAHKGEALILVTEEKDVTPSLLLDVLRPQGLPDLAIPKRVIVLDKIPVLGAGKIDYARTRMLAFPEETTQTDVRLHA